MVDHGNSVELAVGKSVLANQVRVLLRPQQASKVFKKVTYIRVNSRPGETYPYMEAGKDVAAWPPLLTWLYYAVCVVCGEDIMLVSARLPHVTQKLLWARKRGEKGKKRIRSCGLCKPFWKDFSFIK